MRKLLLATILTGLMTGSVALAIPSSGTIKASQTPGLSEGNGGAFNATVITPTASTFQTFCIEEGITFNPGQEYYYQLGSTDHASHDLAFGTAWLFWQFYTAGFGAGYQIDSPSQAGSLQKAIWWFQGQAGGVENSFATLAIATLLLDGYDATLEGYVPGSLFDAYLNGASVDIVQLTVKNADGSRGGPAQDWLVITPNSVPDGGTTAILLGVGLLGVGLVSRKFAAAC